MRGRLLVTSLGVLMAAAPVWAHHGLAAEFDIDKSVDLQGTVTEWELVNPHSWIHMDVKDEKGQVVNWAVEGGSPNNLLRLGFSKASLPVGTEIVVHGFQAKDGSARVVGKYVTFPDGRKLFLGLQSSETKEK